MVLKAAVIGAGMIGAKMDVLTHSAKPQTHAGGYKASDVFELAAICDPKPSKDLDFWGCNIYSDVNQLLVTERPDVVSVAVPEGAQYDILKEIQKHDYIRAVIAEKPLAGTIEKSRDIVRAFEQSDILLLVNYTRRYSKLYHMMANRFKKGEEKVISASVRYAKGLWHNGSHALDLALLLFGNCNSAHKLLQYSDFYDEDPSVTAFLRFQYCPQFILQALDERYYTQFEVDIFTHKARYIIHNDHREMQVFALRDNFGTPPGKRLVLQKTIPTDYEDCMVRLIDHLADILENNSSPICAASDALKSLEIASELA